MSQRHHLVPRFYLNRWSVPGRALKAIRRSTGEILDRSAKTVATETDAYAIESNTGGKDYVAERLLSVVESEAAEALRDMLSAWPPSQEDKNRWSLLMALQTTRGADFRDAQSGLHEYLLKTQVALDSREPESMARRLQDAGLEATEENLQLLRDMMDDPDSYSLSVNPGYLIKTALETGREMIPYFAVREWTVALLDEPLLVTCDHPISVHSAPENRGPFGSVGLMTADETWMPLDPSLLLVMTPPDTESKVGRFPMKRVAEINRMIAWECHEWVVAHPDHPELESLATWLQSQPPPRNRISGPSPREWADMGRRLQSSKDGGPPERRPSHLPES